MKIEHPQSGASNESLAWRTRLLVVVICAFWIVLGGRLVQLQWFSRQRFMEQVEDQSTSWEEIAARPGDILDREGRVLAASIAAKSFFVVPSQLTRQPKQWELVQAIAEAVGQDADQLQARIATHGKKHFLWVSRRITDDDVLAKLYALESPKKGLQLFGFRDEFLRQYPQGHFAAHVLGGRDLDGVGRGGIEQTMNAKLAGKPGYRRLMLDSRLRVIEVQNDLNRTPQHGQSVTLTLDTIIQMHVEEELDRVMEKWRAKHAAAIVLDPKTGEVLAMASRPTYDPNDLTHVSIEAWKNQAIAAIWEPGSTFKPMIVGWGLEHGFIRGDESFHCENGLYRMGRRELHDHHKYGVLSLTDVLVKSSNIGMAKIGQKLGNGELFQAAVTFGFGRRTGIELPGELSGMLAPLKKWTSYSTGSIPMGQEIAVTPIQLLAAHGALANGGTLISPHLVRGGRTQPLGRPWAEKPDRGERTADANSLLQQIAFQTGAASRRVRGFASPGVSESNEEEQSPALPQRDPEVGQPRSLNIVAPDDRELLDDRFDLTDDGRSENRSSLELQLEPLLEEPTFGEDADSLLSSPVVSATISEDVCRWLRESVMTEVIKRGTGKKARLDDYTVFGKTGTAQKRDPQTGKYSNQLHVSSFVGGAPAANPRVLVLVMVDEPASGGEHFGGDIAAPPAREIIHKALRQLGVVPEQKPQKTADAGFRSPR
ncbi:MAG: penicillin-binding protein 2 [Planctomycetes bacterium]|nr:penicillin-binding protein 2 [Planctomycetota bacterium]